MKKVLLGLALCLFAICNTGCSAIDSVLDDYLNYCTVTIEYDYDRDTSVDYKDIKVAYGENEYAAWGSYRVPKGTVINLSWSYKVGAVAEKHRHYVSENVSVGTNGKMSILVYCNVVTVTTYE